MLNKILISLFFIGALFGDTLTGVVKSVHDGDTLTIVDNGKKIRVRLYGIDAPELKQSYGKESGDYLRSLCLDTVARVEVEDTDRYGRTVGKVTCKNEYANLKLVQNGFAWVYRQYNKDKSLEVAEQKARLKHIGLWADKEPLEPWKFRKQKCYNPSTKIKD